MPRVPCVNVNTTDATSGVTALLLPAQNTHSVWYSTGKKTQGGAGKHTLTRDTQAHTRTAGHKDDGSHRRTSQPSKPNDTPARPRDRPKPRPTQQPQEEEQPVPVQYCSGYSRLLMFSKPHKLSQESTPPGQRIWHGTATVTVVHYVLLYALRCPRLWIGPENREKMPSYRLIT